MRLCDELYDLFLLAVCFLKLFSLLFFFQLEKEILTGGRLPVIMSVINLNMQYIHTTYYTNISAWLILYF